MSEVKFDYNSRSKYTKTKYSEWEKSVASKVKKLSSEEEKIMSDVMLIGRSSYGGSVAISNLLNEFLEGTDEMNRPPLSEFIKAKLQFLVGIFVPDIYVEDFYAIVDEMVTFQYSDGWNRRSVRSRGLRHHYIHAIRLMYSYMSFNTYGVSVADYICDKLPPEVLDYKHSSSATYGDLCLLNMDNIIAARINAGDKDVIEAIKTAFLSENNNIVVTTDIIRAVIKARNSELHEYLGKLLVAARLSEGLRQSICEAADCGCPESFIVIMDVIKNENLIRFSSVKRAVSTWCGIGSNDDVDRVIGKVFDEMCIAVHDLEYARGLTTTDDAVKIVIGLWAIGFYCIEDAIELAMKIADNGSRPQLLAVSYFNQSVNDSYSCRHVSCKIFEKYPDDMELIAAYMPTYMIAVREAIKSTFAVIKKGSKWYNFDADYDYRDINLKEFFANDSEARKHYAILKACANSMKKKKEEFAPCIFPWYKVEIEKSSFVERMAAIAYGLKDDDLIDEVALCIGDVDGSASMRSDVLRMLLHNPHTPVQKKALLDLVADKAEYSRGHAFGIVNSMNLTQDDYRVIESFLKYKNEEIRQNVLTLLKKQDDDNLVDTCKRLIVETKVENRLGGFDIIKTTIDEHPEKADKFQAIVKALDEETLTEQEKVLYREILKSDDKDTNSSENGYGLYSDETSYDVAPGKADLKKVKKYFSASRKDIQKVFDALDAFFDDNATKEYPGWGGQTRLLGNGLSPVKNDYRLPEHERYPFPELWEKFYNEHIKTEQFFWNVRFAMCEHFTEKSIVEYKDYKKVITEIFPLELSDFKFNFASTNGYRRGISDYKIVFNCIESLMGFVFPRDIARECVIYACSLDDKYKWYTEFVPEPTNSFMTRRTPSRKFFTETVKFSAVVHNLFKWANDEEFKETFELYRMLDQAYKYQTMSTYRSYSYARQENHLSVYSFVKVCDLGVITEDMVYKYALSELPLTSSVAQLASFAGTPTYRDLTDLHFYMDVDLNKKTYNADDSFYKLGKKISDVVTKLMLSVELKRGDTETEFSNASLKIKAVYGIDTLVDILIALGKDTLDRSTYYYYSSGNGKKQCMSHLLQCCYPLESDNVEYFAKKIKEKKISEDRVIEVAMYAPQWLDIIEQYLKCEGFKSSCYYFMAHMNERFDDKRKAMIAKYTPLSPEELNDGAFDVDWFREAYSQLGDKMFQKLYKAAKYISDGNKHSRARKYADAATGSVNRDELEKTINDKRNQDLLMSYGIIPIKDEADQLHRYEYIQKFLKESKKFGSQRRASEAKSCDMALKNMATVAGYSDSLRLILAMETAIVLNNQKFFDGVEIGEYIFRVSVGQAGKAELLITKAGKSVKSVPAALKKDETVIEIKEFVTKLKDQYSRSVRMFENAMEEREKYAVGELKKLCTNPVIASILNNLVFQLEDGTLSLLEDINCKDSSEVKVAHPFDLYKSGQWSKWQQLFFDKANADGTKQPFKQVFRELYIKLDEEKNQVVSRMFAGNQIQPQKTLAVLKTRRWIADYDEGLQKVYYKDNIIATIYALADWFSPADTEEPTLEYVQFYDRKTFKVLTIDEIPDVIYSEVMRDVDLAVSVAHAGGVDPETSHSTIEMRTVIAGFNIQLFNLKNVKIEGTHAFIEGTHGKYSVHLGSGVTHKMGSHMINILPVHSQGRGKIFLPFVDEDPKTAEIISKIILLSEDNKIKDPFIMEQILK